MDDWSKQFNSLMSSPLGEELVRTLREDLHESILTEARSADSQEKAYGLLKEASGVIKSIEHLKFRSVVPRDKGDK